MPTSSVPTIPAGRDNALQHQTELTQLRAINQRLRRSNKALRVEIEELNELITALDPDRRKRYCWFMYGCVG